MVVPEELQPALIRCDAGTQIGVGHMMRCLALGQAWRDRGGEATFITACESKRLLEHLETERLHHVAVERPYPDQGDWAATSGVLQQHPGAWVVLDGYHFDASYQRRIREAGHPLLVIDDMAHLDWYDADIILNQNLHAHELDYQCEPHTRLLLGTKYVLLRREFLPWQDWQRETPEVARKVLVTMGGSDPDNATHKVVQALDGVEVDGLEVAVVVGSGNPHLRGLETAADCSRHQVRLVHNAVNMPELMAWADMAISAAGSTCWELAFMGVPSILMAIARNQQRLTTSVGVNGGAVALSAAADFSNRDLSGVLSLLCRDREQREQMSQAMGALVDGHGATRVLDLIGQHGAVQLRYAEESDMQPVWEWANEPDTRSASFSTGTISWETHTQWFRAVLGDPLRLLFIATDPKGQRIGSIRFDCQDAEAHLSISIGQEFRGKGLGLQVLVGGCRKVFGTTDVACVVALTRPENRSAHKTFRQGGFVCEGTTLVGGQPALRFVLKRGDALW